MGSLGEMLFHMTEWLRTTWVVDFALWVESTSACNWLQSHFIAIPGFQTLHILSIAVLFGATLMLNLRILGVVGKDQPLGAAFARYQPWILGGLTALVCTGVVLLVSEPVRNMVNPIFWLKMGALLATVLVSIWFHHAVKGRMGQWDVAPSGHAAVRVGATALIVLWMVVMVGGRWIAYAPV
jgi:hypothetical protein